MKTCFKCGIEKPLDDFYKHAGMADGHFNKCKECAKRDIRTHRRENAHVREADNVRYHAKKSDPEFKRMRLDYQYQFVATHPEAKRAHRKVYHAIKAGKLVRGSCSKCGSNENVHAHHEDYSKPLDVTWLCVLCHRREHAQDI